jgi:hypothetical protein
MAQDKPPTRTLAVIARHQGSPEAMVQAGELVDLRFPAGSQLSLRAAKLFCLLVQAAGTRIVEPIQHRLPLASLNQSFHVSIPELEALVDELHGTTIKLHLQDDHGRRFTKSGPILSDVEREDEDQAQAEIRFEFSPALRNVVANSIHWAILSRRAVLAFGSRYALRLYTVLSLRTNRHQATQDFRLDDLRELLGVPSGKLSRWADLRSKVLEPALTEVNQLSGFGVGYTPLKLGRVVVGVTLVWWRKSEADRIAALKELDRPKIGRKARRLSLTEEVAAEEGAAREALLDGLSRAAPRMVD